MRSASWDFSCRALGPESACLLAVLPLRLALLQEGIDAFALVFGVEQRHEQLALQRQVVDHWPHLTGVDQPLAVSHADRALVADLLGQCECRSEERRVGTGGRLRRCPLRLTKFGG